MVLAWKGTFIFISASPYLYSPGRESRRTLCHCVGLSESDLFPVVLCEISRPSPDYGLYHGIRMGYRINVREFSLVITVRDLSQASV